MGEFSKRIGEIGEDVVKEFLRQVGWSDITANFDFPSINPDKHKRQEHSIDGYFHYASPMIGGTLEHILVSSKYSTKSYKNSVSADFKSYYFDLAVAIESFKKSQRLREAAQLHQNVESSFVRGVLFWLNNVVDGNDDLYPKLSVVETPRDIHHDGILIMDKRRVQFIYDSLGYARLIDRGATVEFLYFLSGLNNQDGSLRNGPILPIQYFTSGILPLRIQSSNGETTVLLCTIDPFDETELMKLMGLAKNIGCNVQVNTIISYPNYLESEHLPVVNSVKAAFQNSSFTERLKITNYSNPLLR